MQQYLSKVSVSGPSEHVVAGPVQAGNTPFSLPQRQLSCTKSVAQGVSPLMVLTSTTREFSTQLGYNHIEKEIVDVEHCSNSDYSGLSYSSGKEWVSIPFPWKLTTQEVNTPIGQNKDAGSSCLPKWAGRLPW